MVFTRSVFRSANRNDAIPAIRLWGKVIGQTRGLQVESNVVFVDDVAQIRQHLRAGGAGILVLDVIEYLQLADLATVQPVFSGSRGDQNSPQQ